MAKFSFNFRVIELAMQECGDAVAQYLPINKWDQLQSLLEAQTLLASWTPKNPLWLHSIARSTTASVCTTSLTRLDFYRRCLAVESDSFLRGSPYGFYNISSSMAKHFLSLGHWTKAFNTSKAIFQMPIVKKGLQLESLLLQVGSASAASCSELFASQNKFLHLKFSDNIIENSGCQSLSEVAENGNATAATKATQSQRSGWASTNAHFHCGIASFLMAFVPTGFGLLESKADDQPLNQQAVNNMRGRLLNYYQILQVSDEVDPWRENSEVLLHATGFWLWLLPLEFVYVLSMKEPFANDV